MRSPEMSRGVLYEFASASEMLAAIHRLRSEGYRDLDTYSPFPIPGMEEALGLGRSRLPRVVLVCGLTGAALGFLIQWYTGTVDYPIDVGGRPAFSWPAFVPIAFESAILLAALGAFLTVFLFDRLPRLYHPLFQIDGFERATIDRFWLLCDARDPSFDESNLCARFRELSALRAVIVGGSP